MTQKQVYRFKIHNETLKHEMHEFAEIHAFETRTALKESYETWFTDSKIVELLKDEKNTLMDKGYTFHSDPWTTLKQKVFTSIKYYHIKNIVKGTKRKIEERIPLDYDKWKNEVQFSKAFISSVKRHIITCMETWSSMKPAESLEHFLDLNEESCKQEQVRLNLDDDIFSIKMKKMYKNQYYII